MGNEMGEGGIDNGSSSDIRDISHRLDIYHFWMMQKTYFGGMDPVVFCKNHGITQADLVEINRDFDANPRFRFVPL